MVAACSMVHTTGAAEPRESVVSDLVSEQAFVAARKPEEKMLGKFALLLSSEGALITTSSFFIMLVWVRGCAEC